MAPEATGDGTGSSAMEAATQKNRKRKKLEAAQQKNKPRKRKKVSLSSSSAAEPATRKQRIVWTDELKEKFLKAYHILGEGAVPKKILALMNVHGISRENVASHLQKHRMSLKREEQCIPDKGDERALHAEASSQTPLHSLHHPPSQAPAASSSLYPLPPQSPFMAHLDMMSPLQIVGHGQQLLQTPLDCFISNNDAATNLLLPMVQPIQQRTTPPEATAIATNHCQGPDMEAFQGVSLTGESSVPEANMRYEEAEIRMAQLQMAAKAEEGQAAAASAAGSLSPYWKQLLQKPLDCYSNNDAATNLLLPMVQPIQQRITPPLQATTGATMQKLVETRESSVVPEANMRYEEAEIRMAQLQMAAKAEAEMGQGRAAESGAAAAGSLSPPGSSIIERFWKSDDIVVSWDFSDFSAWSYKTD
ncbi:hypothetical protein BAE44_0016182 [Dichanthelium oligosanthes]|uniref:Myb-like domain-containing protein n=1 Tax=Dichanthelium oligosanthes TaxID=888268 RepID=A0A1E5VCD6_9POAL|nr:hypothetical protein BAE44_0016182 [Dichanthelium oligosanthes]